jgi:MFS family permease
MTTSRSTQTWALGLAATASFVVVLDLLVVSTALSTIRRELGASIEQLEWTVNAYTLSFAVLLLTASALAGSAAGECSPPG